MAMQRRLAVASVLVATGTARASPGIAFAQGGSCVQPGHDHVLLQAHRFGLSPAIGAAVEPHLYKERSLAADEGGRVRDEVKVGSAVECAGLCDSTDACRSFAYSAFQKACHLKDREVKEDDPAQGPDKWHFRTYMRIGPHRYSAVEPSPLPEDGDEPAKGAARVYVGRSLIADEGHELFAKLQATVEECKEICDNLQGCQSFAFSVVQRSCHLKDKRVTKDDLAAEPYLDFKTFMAIDDCAQTIDGGKWTLVRHTRGSGNWGPWDDNLAGVAEQGEPGDGTAPYDWTVPWGYTPQQFLFSFADCSHWLIAEPAQVNGERFADEPRLIVKSSEKAEPYQAKWYNRAGNTEDPWVSERDHWSSGQYDSGAMLYGEAGTAWHIAMKNAHGGANVYIRGSVPDCAQTIDGGDWTLVRHNKGSGNWGPWNDNLAGLAEHGQPTDSLAPHDWTVPWKVVPEQFLFAFADCSHWLIAEPAQVNGEHFADEPRWIVKSSEKAERYQAKWYNRAGNTEDPWVSERDHWWSGQYDSGAMLYGEAGTAWHIAMKNEHGGANVYIRSGAP